MNTGDNEAAAELFAPGAQVVQAGRVTRLDTRAEAIAWNARLPCSGRLVAIAAGRERARATFELRDRETRRCDGPGSRATTIFRVRDGKIVLWHQVTGMARSGRQTA